MKKNLQILVWLLLLPMTVNAQSKVGTTASPFLSIGIGSKAVAMGGAFTAVANDISALYWNPAGIAKTPRTEVVFSHSDWLVGTKIEWAGFTTSFGGYGSFGASVMMLNYGSIERTTEASPEGTGEFFSPSDLSLQLTYAKSLTDRFSIGVSLKYIRQKVYNETASTVAVDLGVLFTPASGLRIGMSISNFGGDMKLDGKDLLITSTSYNNENGANNGIPAKLEPDSWTLPLTFRVGLAYDLLKSGSNRLTIAADGVHPNDNTECMNLGGEYAFNETVFLRAGYNSLFLANSETGLTFGAGLRYDLIGINFKFDYTYQSFNRLNAPQWFTIGLMF